MRNDMADFLWKFNMGFGRLWVVWVVVRLMSWYGCESMIMMMMKDAHPLLGLTMRFHGNKW